MLFPDKQINGPMSIIKEQIMMIGMYISLININEFRFKTLYMKHT